MRCGEAVARKVDRAVLVSRLHEHEVVVPERELNRHPRSIQAAASSYMEPVQPLWAPSLSLDVHEFKAMFRGQSADFHVTSVIGHVFSIDFAPKFQSWWSPFPTARAHARTHTHAHPPE
jgi:hypothetical protein